MDNDFNNEDIEEDDLPIINNDNEDKPIVQNNKSIVNDLFDNDNEPVFIVAVGKSFKGKSYFLRYLINDRFQQGKLGFGLVFTKTNFNCDWSFMPKKAIKEGYDEDLLIRYIDNLKAIKQKDGSIKPNFIIFDDLVGILNNQSGWFINFISTHRHFNTSIYIAVQYLTGRAAISPIMREQTTHALLFNSRTHRTLVNLYESYGGLFDTFNNFKLYYLNATKEKYTAMLYRESIDNIDDNYISIKAPSNAEIEQIDF